MEPPDIQQGLMSTVAFTGTKERLHNMGFIETETEQDAWGKKLLELYLIWKGCKTKSDGFF